MILRKFLVFAKHLQQNCRFLSLESKFIFLVLQKISQLTEAKEIVAWTSSVQDQKIAFGYINMQQQGQELIYIVY